MTIRIFFIYLIALFLPILFIESKSYLIYFDYYSLFVFLTFCLQLIQKDKNFAVVSFYIFFAFITTLVVSLLLEHGVYLLEINEVSYAIGITSKGAITGFLFISAMYFSFSTFKKTNLRIRNLDSSSVFIASNIFRGLLICMMLVLFMLLLQYGFPLFMKVQRADYWASYAPNWGGILVFWLEQFSLLLGFLYASQKRKLDLALFIILIILTILAGSRFTGLFQSTIYFLIPNLVLAKSFKFHHPKFVIASMILFFGLITLVLNSFEATSKQARQDNLMLRIVLQGQMWWALDNKASIYPKSSNEIINSYIGISNNPNAKGINYLMYLVAPSEIVNQKVDTDSRFTMSGFFNTYYFFGYFLGFLINTLYGLLFGLLLYLLFLGLKGNNIIFILFIFKSITKMTAILVTGNVDDLFSFNTIIFLSICLLFLYFPKNVRMKHV